jgi:hypothetical protein
MQFNRFKDAALSLPALFSRSVCDYFDADVRAAVVEFYGVFVDFSELAFYFALFFVFSSLISELSAAFLKAVQVLYMAAPSTASDLDMILPWALSVLLLQVEIFVMSTI